jgi:glycogen(starch) synthase
MRVLHLTTEFPPVIYGGLGTAVGGWAKACARAGVEIAVQLVGGILAIDGTGALYGAPRHRTSGRDVSSARESEEGIRFIQCSEADAIAAGVRAVEEWRPDVVHLHTAMLWYLASAIKSATGKPLVFHVHSVDRAEYDIGNEPNPFLAQARGQEEAIIGSDRLIALTRAEEILLRQYYPQAAHKIRVVGNGIEDTEAALAATISTRPEMPTVLYSGRLVERKGIRELLAAIPEVLQAVPGARFVLTGGPPTFPASAVAAQWLETQHTPFLERIHFTGWQSPSEMTLRYAAADVLVVPSRYEPFGMVLLEGMLHGLAIVAADVGGPAEILEHGRTGLLFPPRDVKALSSALQQLLENPDERHALGRAAAHQVRSKWLWKQLVPPMLDVYKEFLIH